MGHSTRKDSIVTKTSYLILKTPFHSLAGAVRLRRRTLSPTNRQMISSRPVVLWGVAALIATAMLVGGCSTQEKIAYEPVNTRPIVGDDAMALRSDWPKSVCYYPNGDVTAWSTRYPYQASEARSDTGNLLLDSVTFIAETAFLPVELIANPPGEPQVWYGVKYPPTYTFNPPLPPSNTSSKSNSN
jgi:hypothetical protein